jgi:hypothetical protein
MDYQSVLASLSNKNDMLTAKYDKVNPSEELVSYVTEIVNLKSFNRSLTLDEISIILKVPKSKVTKAIKSSGFVWNRSTKLYEKLGEEDILKRRVSLSVKKRKRINVKVSTATAVMFDHLLENLDKSEERLIEILIQEKVAGLSSGWEIIDIFTD